MFFKKKTKKEDIKKLLSSSTAYDIEYIPKKIPTSKKKITVFELVFISFIMLIFGIVSGCLITIYTGAVYGTKLDGNIAEFLNTYEYVKDNYYEEVDEEKLMKAAISGMINSLGDDFSYYMDEDSTNSFNMEVDGQYTGLGITIQYSEDGTKIIDMFEDSPASKAGLQVGDVILKVNDQDVSKSNSSEISSIILGDEDKKVSLTVRRGEEELTFDLSLEVINIPSVSSSVKESNGKKIGYINVNNFAANTYDQFNKNLKKIEKEEINSLIIDIRSNTGGHLSQVTEMLDLFFDKKTVIYQIETKGKAKKYYAKTKDHRDYPVVILVNGETASASEVLTACFMENYKDVTVVGTKTYGKGTVQQAFNLSNGASYKFTTQKWLTPKGNWIHEVGITPDVEIEYDAESEEDNQLNEAIRILSEK